MAKLVKGSIVVVDFHYKRFKAGEDVPLYRIESVDYEKDTCTYTVHKVDGVIIAENQRKQATVDIGVFIPVLNTIEDRYNATTYQ